MKKILLLLAMLGYVGTVVPAALAAEKKKKKAAYSEDAGAVEKAVGAEKVDAAQAEDEDEWVQSDDSDNDEDAWRPSAFQKAVYDGASKAELQDLVTKGAVVNELHAHMGSTLMIPVITNQPAVFTALLELGADPYQAITMPVSGVRDTVAHFIEIGGAQPGIQKAWQQWKDSQAAAALMVVPSVMP